MRVDRQLHVRIGSADDERLGAAAEQEGVAKATIVRRAIRRELARDREEISAGSGGRRSGRVGKS